MGGKCEYKPFAGSCALQSIGSAPVEGGAIVTAIWTLPTDGMREWETRWTIDAAKAPALIAHVKQHAPAPCSGEYIVSGSCTPWSATVDVPAFPGAVVKK